MADMIVIRALSRHFGPVRAVEKVSLSIAQGEVLGFLGPNGAGKSTTMKMLAGFLTPSSGGAEICGFDILKQPIEARKRLGYLPEGAPAYPDMKVAGFLSFIAAIRGLRRQAATRAIAKAVERANLGAVLHQRIETLSKGFKRRVGLAQALLHDPDVLILDEPTDGLDPNQKHEVRSLIQTMAQEKAIIISTHILEEVEAVCSRAVIIAQGKLVADGAPGALLAQDPRHNAVFLTLTPSETAQACSTLLQQPEVGEVTVIGEGQVQILPQNRQAVLLPLVAGLAHQQGWSVLALYSEKGRFDSVFRTITTA